MSEQGDTPVLTDVVDAPRASADATHVVDGAAGSAAGESAGDLLRAGREAKGLSVADAAQALKLSPRQIEQMESSDWDALPGTTFVRGFIRNYARLLGIDADHVLGRIGQDAATPAQALDIPDATGVEIAYVGEGERKDMLAVVVAGVLIVVALLVYFLAPASLFSGAAKTVAVSKTVPQATPEIVAADTAVPAVAAADHAVGVASEQQSSATAVDPRGAVGGSESPVVDKTAPGAGGSAAVTNGRPEGLEVPARPAPFPVDGPKRAVSFVVETLSWIEVIDAGGNQIFANNLPDGSRRVVRGVVPLDVVIGNGAGVTMSVDGAPFDLKPFTRGNVARVRVE